MENASKALLIAGALLIAILLITIGIAIYNGAGGILNQGKTALTGQELMLFNQKFTSYEGTITGSSLKALVEVININNADDNNPQVGITDNSELVNNGPSVSGDIENGFKYGGKSLYKYTVDINTDAAGQVNNITIKNGK